jgi:hypothetical protein
VRGQQVGPGGDASEGCYPVSKRVHLGENAYGRRGASDQKWGICSYLDLGVAEEADGGGVALIPEGTHRGGAGRGCAEGADRMEAVRLQLAASERQAHQKSRFARPSGSQNPI